MNPPCSDSEEDEDYSTSDDDEEEQGEQSEEAEQPEQVQEHSSYSSSDDNLIRERPSEDEDDRMSKFYDQHIGTYAYQTVWIPDGLYLTRNEKGTVVQDTCSGFYGNSILAHLGTTEAGLNRYLWISCSVKEFTTDDEIQRYYSTVVGQRALTPWERNGPKTDKYQQ
jgi:hypothetical protein